MKDDKDSSEEKEAGKKGSETDDIPTMALSRFQEHFHIWKQKKNQDRSYVGDCKKQRHKIRVMLDDAQLEASKT